MTGKGLIQLPQPRLRGEVSLEETIKARRSVRDYKDKPLNLIQLNQLLWAGQGITEEGGDGRAAPSAGALYPLDLFIVVGERKVEGLKAGLYHYLYREQALELLKEGDLRKPLALAALGQMFIAQAPIDIVITAEYIRTTRKYGERGVRYVHNEVGHVGQNISLQGEALGLKSVIVGAFYDERVIQVLSLPKNYQPIYIIPIGYGR